MKLLTLKVFAFTLLSVYSNLTYAYNDWYIDVLRSFYNAKEASISVHIPTHFFDQLEAGESEKDFIANLFTDDDVDKSLGFNGRVPKSLVTLLSDKLEKRFSIKTVDWKVAQYHFDISARVVQAIGMYGDDIFHIRMDIELQELATARSGKTGFMPVMRFGDSSSAKSKVEVETKIYVTLDKVIEKIQEVSSQSIEYCAKEDCKLSQ